MKTVVIGLGNPVLSDDSVGWHVLAKLRERLGARDDVVLEESARGGLGLMEQMIGYDRAVVVDAVRTGAPPGTIHRLAPDRIPTQNSASIHDANLATALAVGRRAGARLPEDGSILLVAVEAADTGTFSEQCTPPVRAAIPRAVEAVAAALDTKRNP